MSERRLKLVRLRTWTERDAASTMSVLRKTVREARTGRPVAVLVITQQADGSTRAAYHNGDRSAFLRMGGAVEEWKAETFAKMSADRAQDKS